MTTRETLGDYLRRARTARGMTQGALAGRIGVRQPQVSRWESNVCIPNARQLGTLARALCMDAHYAACLAAGHDDIAERLL